jgi:hypothetical protein
VAATVELAAGSTFVGFVSSDRGWLCSGGNVVGCSLQSTLPSPPGNNVTFFTIAATPPSSPSNATIHASVTSSAQSDPPTNNEAWISFGKANKTGTRSGQHPQVDIVRVDDQSIAANLLDPASFPPPPSGYTPSTDLVLLVVTPPAPGGSKKQAITVTLTFNASSAPSASILVLNHGSNAWELVTQKCGGNGPFPCIDSVSFNKQTGVATLVYLTQHFSHLHK